MGGRGPQSFLRNGPQVSEFDKRRGAKSGLCYAAVVVDGIFVFSGSGDAPQSESGHGPNSGEELFNINSIPPSQIAGIEVYNGPATMPAKLSGPRMACGLVVIWTK